MVFDNLARLSRTTRYAVFGALIMILTIVTYDSIVAPHVGYLSAVQQYEYVVGDLAKRTKIVSTTVKTRTKELEKLQEQCQQLEGTLFSPKKAKEFLSDLRPLSEEVGCAAHSLRLITNERGSEEDNTKNPAGIVANRAMLSVAGMYGSIISFMERLQAYTQNVWIDSLTMQALNDDSNELKCDMRIVIYTIQNRSPLDE